METSNDLHSILSKTPLSQPSEFAVCTRLILGTVPCVQDLQLMVEEEQRGRDDAREAAAKAERRVGDIASELDELRNQLEQVRVSL